MTDEDTKNIAPKSPTRSIAMWLVVLNYAQAGISFVINFWLARTLGSDAYGLFQYGVVVGGICTVLVGFSSDRTLVRDLVQSKDSNATLTASLVLRVVMTLVVVGFCLVWVLLSDSLGPKRIPIVLCSVWGAMSALSSRGWLDSHYKMHIHAAITFAERVGYAICVFLLVRYAFEGNYAIVAAACLVVFRGLSLACEWGYASRTYVPSFASLQKNVCFLVDQNWLVLMAALSTLLMTHANQLLLEHQQGSSQLASYAVANQVVLMIQLFLTQVVRLLAPRTAELTRSGLTTMRLRRTLLRYIASVLAASLLIVAPIFLFGPWLIKTLLPVEYAPASDILQILCCWPLLYGPALVINQFLLGFRRRRAYFLISISAGLLSIGLCYLLLPRFGGPGAAASLILSHSVSVLMQFMVVWKTIGTEAARDG
ncbi:MAG: oligosaccharide flippase family protein [Planctomycetota bacterium]